MCYSTLHIKAPIASQQSSVTLKLQKHHIKTLKVSHLDFHSFGRVGNCDSFMKRKNSVINETKRDEISLKPKV